MTATSPAARRGRRTVTSGVPATAGAAARGRDRAAVDGPVDAGSGTRNQSASLRRGVALLGYVRDHAGAGRGVKLTELAEDLSLSKSSVLRLAAPLIEADLLARDRETGAFRLGHGALRLGQAYLSRLDLRTIAAVHANQLMRATNHTVHLVVYDAPHVVYVDKVENETSVRMASRVGSRAPAYRTGVGKAILAWLPPAALDEVLAGGLVARTPYTITDPDRLRAELARIRERGFAVDDRENEPEVRCVAAPIFDHTDTVAGALSVSGLSFRLTAARVRELGPLVAQAARRISAEMGATR
ncbi:IclR family transcriptional regulator [Rugosimonospora africana]|uniref:IclR family transcriptional regulator n=1 Tax=Rugosimonospora africana TaxID=556532 RepID=A0A8J3R1K7_9ACTN|nr:IclR family transcriptional regulator [Rugosimonospora africana]GIH21394.1 IclR family transcriptional regulator [Rugosimonospora africana]